MLADKTGIDRIAEYLHYSLFISMDGVAENSSLHFLHFPHPCGSYAENRLERFQCIFHYSLFIFHCMKCYIPGNKHSGKK